MIGSEVVPTRRPGVLDYRLGGEVVVYDPATSQAASLNETAAMIWTLCDGKRNVRMLCVELVQHFEASGQDVELDILSGLEQLHGLGLLCV